MLPGYATTDHHQSGTESTHNPRWPSRAQPAGRTRQVSDSTRVSRQTPLGMEPALIHRVVYLPRARAWAVLGDTTPQHRALRRRAAVQMPRTRRKRTLHICERCTPSCHQRAECQQSPARKTSLPRDTRRLPAAEPRVAPTARCPASRRRLTPWSFCDSALRGAGAALHEHLASSLTRATAPLATDWHRRGMRL